MDLGMGKKKAEIIASCIYVMTVFSTEQNQNLYSQSLSQSSLWYQKNIFSSDPYSLKEYIEYTELGIQCQLESNSLQFEL